MSETGHEREGIIRGIMAQLFFLEKIFPGFKKELADRIMK